MFSFHFLPPVKRRHLLDSYHLLLGQKQASEVKVLVPLVEGKSADLLWIWRRGHETFGLERMPSLMADLIKDVGYSYDGNNNVSPACINSVANKLMLILQTQLSEPVVENSFHVVWDTCLVYCRPELRVFFVECIRRLIKKAGSQYFLVALELAQPEFHRDDKAPFQLSQSEVNSLFASFAQVQRITPKSSLSTPASFPFTQVLYHITL